MRFILTLLFFLLTQQALAQQAIVNQFERRTQTRGGFTLPYRLFVPAEYDSTQAFPLVLALHGAGERGTDNERHIQLHRLATSWADPANQATYPAFVVAPQAPPNGSWTNNNEALTTFAILDSLANEFNIDPDRVYITGLSMGGHGTWNLIDREPARFAAAVPMSGNAFNTLARQIQHIPIWAFHGESDTVVPVSGSRAIIRTLAHDYFRDVLYTDCRQAPAGVANFDCPGVMPDSALAAAIRDHADLIFTGKKAGGHGPWDVWYDHPRLFEWVFSKTRVDPEAIALDTPAPGSVWDGSVTWTSTHPADDTVEVWLSEDNGGTWSLAGEAPLGSGTFTTDATSVADTPVARIRLFTRNQAGRIDGKTTSEPFYIDHAGDAPPYLAIDHDAFRLDTSVRTTEVEIDFFTGDPERSELTWDLAASFDGGTSYAVMAFGSFPAFLGRQTLVVDATGWPNSAETRVRLDVSDGTHTVSDTTAVFIKDSPRIVNDYTEHLEGEGVGEIALHFIDPSALTGHRYRITFDDLDPAAKTYSVADLDLGATVLEDEPLSDGVRESPLFDGIRLVVKDLQTGMPDPERTGWTLGASTLGITVNGGTAILALNRTQLLATETDYVIEWADAIVDTSLALFAIPAQGMKFTVRGLEDGILREVLYKDLAGDGRPSAQDLLYILEPGPDGEPAPAWELRFTSNLSTQFPVAGDTYLLAPLHKLSSADVFEFIAAEGVAVDPDPALPAAASLAPGFPNPFSERVQFSFALSEPDVIRLEVFDLLGRRIAVLDDGMRSAGTHEVSWNGRDAAGRPVPSGLFVVRLVAKDAGMLGQQTIVHIQ